MYNVIGVSLSLGLIKMPPDSLLKSIDSIFSKKPQIAEINKQAANYSYNLEHQNLQISHFHYLETKNKTIQFWYKDIKEHPLERW